MLSETMGLQFSVHFISLLLQLKMLAWLKFLMHYYVIFNLKNIYKYGGGRK